MSRLNSNPNPVPPGLNYEKAIEFLSPQFESFGFTCTKHVMPENTFLEKQKSTNQLLDGPRINLQAEKKSGKKPGLVLYAHVDVVPVQEESWTVPPWEGVIKDGKMYGRGTSDCKSSIAAILGALETISALKLDLAFDLNILITTDEEVGPYSGLCWLADMDVVWGDYFFCLDGSSDTLGIGANGMLEWMVEVHGKSVHSGISFLGQNAIEQTNLIISGFLELKNEIEKRRSVMPSSPEIQNQTGGKRANISPVLNVTMINSGVKVNIVPDKCVIKGDRRYIPEENIDDVIKELEDKLAEIKNAHPELSYELKTRKIYGGYSTEPTHSWVSFVKNIISYIKDEEPPIAGAQGSIDVGCVMEKRKIPQCAFGAGTTLESRIHGHDENILVSDLLDLTKVIALVITNPLD
ncbi:ArgE/DapE family deacylase [Candidatus Borrarchaeum sp.]|uniref:M20 family metallopeptidase n=1 Tax=Candidatus Borrarchaeum sp. TaxID=2846742 RepID=UPI00257C9999|nr:ArgE/DapE family deacylase [Candidatus Borrarchaeum sp.]